MDSRFSKPARLAAIVSASIVLLSSTFAQEPNRQLVQNATPTVTNNKRIALVIGNGAYTTAPPLRNPPNDARDMSATLRTLGFDVVSGINVTQKDMKRLIREFGVKLKNGGSGLFYYAGHGVQSKGRNYLIPIDADIQSEAEVEDSGVDAGLVLNYLDEAQNGLNIVILDACRNNPFARSFRSASDGLAQVDAPTGTLIAYATAPGRVASDGTAQNGLYTGELLRQMKVPGVSVTDMFMRVRAEVMKQTGNKQVPWESSSLVGAFYFAGSPSDVIPVTSTAKIDPVAFELSYWETIKNSSNADDFKAYLARYPQGQFAELAKNRVATLTTAAKPAETSSPVTSGGGAAELAFWDAIKNSTSADDYRAYLEKYPNGEFAGLARRRLAPLEANEKERARADEEAHNIKKFKGAYVLFGAMGGARMPGTLIITPNKIEMVYDDVPENRLNGQVYKPYTIKCSDLTEARIDDVFVREIRDGRQKTRFQAESAAAASDVLNTMRYVCANRGKTFDDSSNNGPANSSPSISPTAKVFNGYYGIMSAGFTARAGKLVVSPSNIQFVWNSGKDGIGDLVRQTIAENPAPYQLQCASFAQARIENDFIREIKQQKEALIPITGWPGENARFKASSAAEAAAAFSAIREACSPRAANGSSLSLEGTTWTGESPGGDKHYEFRFETGGRVVWNQKMASNVTYEGTWSQNGDKITMNFRGLDDPVLVTIQGNQMSGSWYHGRYQLTATKVQ